jgi:hypothetical protein
MYRQSNAICSKCRFADGDIKGVFAGREAGTAGRLPFQLQCNYNANIFNQSVFKVVTIYTTGFSIE